MDVNVKCGWITAVRQLAANIPEGGGEVFTPIANTPVPDDIEDVEGVVNYLEALVGAMITAGVMADGGEEE